MTTKEAAAMLGVSVRHIQTLVKNGQLKARKDGRDWKITKADARRLRRRKPGRQRREK